MRERRLPGLLLAGVLVCGCESYRALPLEDAPAPRLDAVAADLSRRAADLHNPLLRPGNVDLSDGLSPAEAAVAAVVLNPTLRAARDKNALADAQAVDAGILPNPVLSFSLDAPIGSNTGGEVVGYGLSVDWEITSLITRGAKVAAATQAAAQGRLDVAWAEWQVAQAARQATYDVIAQQQQLTAADALSTRLDGIAAAYHAALRRHDVLGTEAAAVDAAAGDAKVAVAATKRDLADAELSLRRALGAAEDAAVPIDSRTALPSSVDVPDAQVLIEKLAEHRIDLVALRRGYDSQEASVRAAVLGQFPKISLGVSNTRDTGDFLTLGPALSVDLPVFDRNQGKIRIERATRQQLKDEYAARLFEARSDVARAVTAVRGIGQQIVAADAQVRQLQAVVDSSAHALGQGNTDVASFYTAAVDFGQKQTELVKLRQELVHARITLELAAGVYLPDQD